MNGAVLRLNGYVLSPTGIIEPTFEADDDAACPCPETATEDISREAVFSTGRVSAAAKLPRRLRNK